MQEIALFRYFTSRNYSLQVLVFLRKRQEYLTYHEQESPQLDTCLTQHGHRALDSEVGYGSGLWKHFSLFKLAARGALALWHSV